MCPSFGRLLLAEVATLLAGFCLALPAQPTTVKITEYAVPTPFSDPSEITAGPDKALWFTEYTSNKVGRITTGGAFTEYNVPTTNSGPYGITTGPDGALWFAENFSNKIGRITTAGTVTEFPVSSGSYPVGITTGPDGALWFAESGSNNNGRIGRLTTSGTLTEYSISLNSGPAGIAVGADGALWFTESSGNKIGRITTAGVVAEYSVPTANSSPWRIASGPDGALWFTESTGNKIGRITTAGAITEFTLSTVNNGPTGITEGPDGELWFTGISSDKIGRITTAGVVTEYSVPTANSGPWGITTGPDSALWFIENQAAKVGQAVVTSGQIYTITGRVSSAINPTQGISGVRVFLNDCTPPTEPCPGTQTGQDGAYSLSIQGNTAAGNRLYIVPVSSGPNGYVFSPSFFVLKRASAANVNFTGAFKPTGPQPKDQPAFKLPMESQYQNKTVQWRVNTEPGGYVDVGVPQSDKFHTNGADQSNKVHSGYGFYAVDFNHDEQQPIPILAAADGTVIFAGPVGTTNPNYEVWISHGKTKYITKYLHLQKDLLVSEKESVCQGKILGYMGTSGMSSGVHLHFQVYYGGTNTANSQSTVAELTGLLVDSAPFISFTAGHTYVSTNVAKTKCQ